MGIITREDSEGSVGSRGLGMFGHSTYADFFIAYSAPSCVLLNCMERCRVFKRIFSLLYVNYNVAYALMYFMKASNL